jgi:hypothetical protein
MRWTRTTRTDVLLTAAATLVVSGPMLFTRSGFGEDFTNTLWLVWVAGKTLAQAGHPEFFLNTQTLGVFYPLFTFYGGPLYMTTGAISELLGGNAEIAFIGVTMVAIAGTYGGMVWLGREFGLRGLVAHAPALVVVTSAYYITNLYGRGAWTEFMVTSAIAPLLASAIHLVRAKVWKPLPIAIFVLSTALFTAGHNITLLWGSMVGAAALLILWLALGAPRRLPYRRLAMLGGLGLASTLVNAWFLLPDIAYAGNVAVAAVARNPPPSASIWLGTRGFNLPGVLLDPLRRVPRESSTPALYVQAPDWFMAWGLFAAALLLWRPSVAGALRRVWVSAIVVVALLLAMILIAAPWPLVRYPFNELQFPYRLSSFLFYAVAALVLVAALALQRVAAAGGPRPLVRGLKVALVAASAVSLSLCVWQEWVPNTLFFKSYTDRAAALASPNVVPNSWYAFSDYDDAQAPIVTAPAGRRLIIDPTQVQAGRFAAWMNPPPGPQPIQTNIAGGPYLVHLRGIRLVGRSRGGIAVVKRTNPGNEPVYVVIETAHSAPIELGPPISAAATLLVLLIVARAWVRTRRRRTARRAGPRSEPAPTVRTVA